LNAAIVVFDTVMNSIYNNERYTQTLAKKVKGKEEEEISKGNGEEISNGNGGTSYIFCFNVKSFSIISE
jgi:uncharacterized secreted protein with C-terminal beta-propeller domain